MNTSLPENQYMLIERKYQSDLERNFLQLKQSLNRNNVFYGSKNVTKSPKYSVIHNSSAEMRHSSQT